jgi:hypothetical protein
MLVRQVTGCPSAHTTEPLPGEYLGPTSFALVSHWKPFEILNFKKELQNEDCKMKIANSPRSTD